MNPERQLAVNYLRAPGDGLWRWAEDGKVVVWRDGSTVAFKEEIISILDRLAPDGLPPFGAIVLLLAACRGKVPHLNDVYVEPKTPLPTRIGKDPALLLSARKQLKVQLSAALVELAAVQKLPAEVRAPIQAKCLLAEAVFELARAERHVDARAVVVGLRDNLNDTELFDAEQTSVYSHRIRHVHMICQGLKRHTAESLALRLRTGLDQLPGEIDQNLPSAERARRLIEELSRDREHGAVGRAARELMAAVRLPRRLGIREELAVGGVADITNRGPLDRLLLSELAHDDLTLSVRVALNEALYLRREPPRREPPGTLAFLLDSGIRLWGMPRVIATAVALAFIAREKRPAEVISWRAQGRKLASVDLLSRQGLTQHLGVLETEAHPGAALAAFVEAVPEESRNRSVLITHIDSLDDPEFRRALAENASGLGFIAAVDRHGRFELYSLPLARGRAVCAADLDLDAVFNGPAVLPRIRKVVAPDLPLIFGVSPFPFLLPAGGKIDCWKTLGDGVTFATLNDRRLLRFRDATRGARVVMPELPSGETVWMDCDHLGDANEVVHVVKQATSQRPARLVSIALPDPQVRVFDLSTGPELLAVHRYGEVILAVRMHDVRAYSLLDGRLLGQTRHPAKWLRGRFFQGNARFYFAAWNGERISFEVVTMPSGWAFHEIVTIFDREGTEGPWAFNTKAEVISTASQERIRLATVPGLTPNQYQLKVSADGHRLKVTAEKPALDLSFDLKRHEPRLQALAPTVIQSLDQAPILPYRNLYRVVEFVAPVPDGLAFCGRKNTWRKISLDAERRLVIGKDEDLRAEQKISLVGPIRKMDGCTLESAHGPNGGTVFLDSRGLLHLKSSDPKLPEVSLVLASGEVAGWTSDGYVCGLDFFFDGPFHSDPARVFDRMMKVLHSL